MTVIRPNSISGVTSITALTQSIEFYKSDGSLSGANIDGISINTAGIITASTFYGNGSNLTGISAGTSLSGSTNNTVCTVTGANAIQGESNFTYDGTTLQLQSSGSGLRELLRLKNSNASAGVSGLYFNSTTSGTAFDAACVRNGVNGSGQGRLFLQTNNGSGLVTNLEVEYDGQVTIANNSLNIGDSIVHYGDTNTKIRFPSPDTISFETAGSERLRINSTGNVSIGGIDPVPTASYYNSASLHIHQTGSGSATGAQIHLTSDHTGSAAGDGSQLSVYSTSLYINNQENGSTYFYNNGSATATILANGNFGVGTQAPTDKLHVNGTSNLVGNSYIGGDLFMYGGSYSKGIFIGGSGSSNKLDDYEEGNYNISVYGSGGGTIGAQSGIDNLRYTKIGRMVHVTGRIYLNQSNNPSGSARMTLPFTSSANTNDQNGQGYSYVTRYNVYNPNSDWNLIFEIEPNQSWGGFLWDKPGSGWDAVNAGSELNQTACYLGFDFTYTTAT